jgi:hypothetical protein
MGRHTTGIITVDQALRLDLWQLIKLGYIKKGCELSGEIVWNNGSRIGYKASYTDSAKYLLLHYTHTNNSTGERNDYDYYVYFDTEPSNLGKGELLYFICPETGIRCRILYNCYGSHVWKARNAYRNRIYYSSQITSKRYYYNTRYWNLEDQLTKIKKGRKSYLYNGRITKKAIRIQKMEELQCRYDVLRFQNLPAFLGHYIDY